MSTPKATRRRSCTSGRAGSGSKGARRCPSASSRARSRKRNRADAGRSARAGSRDPRRRSGDHGRPRAADRDIGLLARRLDAATRWLLAQPDTAALPLGYFGASTGAAAALIAAADRSDLVRAVVSRGGRPDLVGDALARVRAPTLLIVGGHDEMVLELNRQALEQLTAEKQLEIIPGATHLFEEPGALEQVAELARGWFERWLAGGRGE